MACCLTLVNVHFVVVLADFASHFVKQPKAIEVHMQWMQDSIMLVTHCT